VDGWVWLVLERRDGESRGAENEKRRGGGMGLGGRVERWKSTNRSKYMCCVNLLHAAYHAAKRWDHDLRVSCGRLASFWGPLLLPRRPRSERPTTGLV
jgi:hypothetical protein